MTRLLRQLAPAALLAVSACAHCGASDGWEKVYNPLCRAAADPTPAA